MRDLELALKAAGDPTRTRILRLLEKGELCVCQVQAVLGLAPSTISKHLSILKTAGLVDDRRDGKWIYYAHADGKRNPHGPGLLSLLNGPLDKDPRILADKKRLRDVLAQPAVETCAANPMRKKK
jgi:ArsR family transcriptional regulator, arsenate/arsenite/antimonite-responsive transcriptional repressor